MIRRAVANDLPEIRRIRGTVRENRRQDTARATPEMIAWFMDGPGIWVWEEADAICGFAAADPRDGKVWALFVDTPNEGRGIGGALLDAVCTLLADAGHREFCLETEPGKRAEAFYRARGWTGDEINERGELLLRRHVGDEKA